jgi:hypothetical protein
VPAPAVIPAPIAYIKVVAVKKLVVETGRGWPVRLTACTGLGHAFPLGPPESASLCARDGLGLLL